MSLRTDSPEKWPVYLDARNIGEIFDCSTRSAQRKIAKGLFGRFIELDGKRFVRRGQFLDALKRLEQPGQVALRRRR